MPIELNDDMENTQENNEESIASYFITAREILQFYIQ